MEFEAEGDADHETGLRVLVAIVLVAVVVGGLFDMYLERPRDWLSVHVAAELALMLLSGGTGMLLWRAWRRAVSERTATVRSLATSEVERRRWRERAQTPLAEFRRVIDEQLDTWGLTPAEREVAMLLLKGAGHKQIAAQTHRSVSTVRQHAVSVYDKSGQRGRAELAAFFLEGLLLPQDPSDASSAVGVEPHR